MRTLKTRENLRSRWFGLWSPSRERKGSMKEWVGMQFRRLRQRH